MKLCRCPVCHSDLTLEALIEDDSGRELLVAISQLNYGCSRPMVAYLGLFKPAKSALSNSRALKILRDVLERFPCSNLLAHSLSETVEQVRKNRRESSRVEPLANHNYLKKVYDTNRPHFSPSGHGEKTKSNSTEQRRRDEERYDAIMYIERMANLGRLDDVKNTKSYQIWLAWKNEQGGKGATTN